MSDHPDLSHYIVRNLDDSEKLLWWTWDVAALAGLIFLIGVVFDYLGTGLVVALLVARIYRRHKIGGHPAATTHALFWVIGMPTTKELPESGMRWFNG